MSEPQVHIYIYMCAIWLHQLPQLLVQLWLLHEIHVQDDVRLKFMLKSLCVQSASTTSCSCLSRLGCSTHPLSRDPARGTGLASYHFQPSQGVSCGLDSRPQNNKSALPCSRSCLPSFGRSTVPNTQALLWGLAAFQAAQDVQEERGQWECTLAASAPGAARAGLAAAWDRMPLTEITPSAAACGGWHLILCRGMAALGPAASD